MCDALPPKSCASLIKTRALTDRYQAWSSKTYAGHALMGAPVAPGQVYGASGGRLQVGHMDCARSASHVLQVARQAKNLLTQQPAGVCCSTGCSLCRQGMHGLRRASAALLLAVSCAACKLLLCACKDHSSPTNSRVDVTLLAALVLLHPLATSIHVVQLSDVGTVVAEALGQGALQRFEQPVD